MKTGLYKHYKGQYYQVVGVARHEVTHKPLVIYQAHYGDFALWARDLEVFESMVEIDGTTIPRFEFIRENLAEMPKLD
jgi:hypothetical protein